MNAPVSSTKVWDPIIRIGHWTLVIAFFTAYFTEDEFMTQHIWAGYVLAGVVVFRIIWGLIGSKHARFTDFIYRPTTIFAYLKSLAQRKPAHYLGHNPAGGAMVIALLISLCVTAYSGLALYAVEENAGPFASIYGASAQQNLNATASASTKKAQESEETEEAKEAENENKSATTTLSKTEHTARISSATQHQMVNAQDEEFWEGLHAFFANFTLLLVVLHVAGVLVSSHLEKVNLIKAMFTGRKNWINKP